MVEIIIFFIGCFFVFFGKAVSDITDNETVWSKSIFSSFPKESFFGSKEYTYIRKDHSNPLKNYLLHTIFVFVTDIWHTGNLIRHTGIYLSIAGGMLLGTNYSLETLYLILSIFTFVNFIGFHLFYTYLLRSKTYSFIVGIFQ
jgi:hypothetical protein